MVTLCISLFGFATAHAELQATARKTKQDDLWGHEIVNTHTAKCLFLGDRHVPAWVYQLFGYSVVSLYLNLFRFNVQRRKSKPPIFTN